VSAGTGIPAGAGRAMLHREGTETTQLDPVAARERRDDLVEDRVHDILNIPLVEVRVVLGNTLNEFGFDHREVKPRGANYPFP